MEKAHQQVLDPTKGAITDVVYLPKEYMQPAGAQYFPTLHVVPNGEVAPHQLCRHQHDASCISFVLQ